MPIRALLPPIERMKAMKRGPLVRVDIDREKIPSYITYFS